MKYVRFYQDFGDGAEGKRAKRRSLKTKELAKNALALFLNDLPNMEALVSLTNDPDSHVALEGVSKEYLRDNCKRCSEEVARKIHPNLFKRLSSENEGSEPKPVKKTFYAPGPDRYGDD